MPYSNFCNWFTQWFRQILTRANFAQTFASIPQTLESLYTLKANFVPTFDASSGFPRSVCTVKVRTVEKTGTIGTSEACILWMKPALLSNRRSCFRMIAWKNKKRHETKDLMNVHERKSTAKDWRAEKAGCFYSWKCQDMLGRPVVVLSSAFV